MHRLVIFALTLFLLECYNCTDPDFCEHSAKSTDCDAKDDIETAGDIDESLNSLDQADPKLVEIIKERYLVPPSTLPYNFSNNAQVDMKGEEILQGKHHPRI